MFSAHERSRPRPRPAWLALGAWLWLWPAASGAQPQAPVPIHPAVGDTVDAREAARFGLFTDAPGLRDAVVLPAPWGGYLLRMRLDTERGVAVRERNVTTEGLRAWRAGIDAALTSTSTAAPAPPLLGPTPADTAAASGTTLADSLRAVADTLRARAESRGRVKVWPEASLPPARPRLPGWRGSQDADRPGHEGAVSPPRWLLGVSLGYRHCITDFREFFTDQGLLEFTVANRLTSALSPYFAFQIGFGDIQDDFEAVSDNGRSALYALELGLLARTDWGARSSLYAGAGGGYYMRSLRWGGEPFVAIDGSFSSGTLVWELQDWGFSVRAGAQVLQGPSGKRQRALDIQLRYEDYGASELSPFGAQDRFFASGRDRWLALAVSLYTRL